jgi:Tfp pilus assembly protein PilW
MEALGVRGMAFKKVAAHGVRFFDKPVDVNREHGFTLVELCVYMVMLLLVIGAVYSVLITNTKSHSSQENMVEMTQSNRAAMALMTNEIRSAGCDPASVGGLGFQDDADDNYDTDANSIHFTFDSDSDGVVSNSENVLYYRKTAGGVQQIIRRTGGGTEGVVAENVTNLSFTYRFADGDTGIPDDTDGDSTNDLEDIRSVSVTIINETDKIDPVTGVKKTRIESSWVQVRNAGF